MTILLVGVVAFFVSCSDKHDDTVANLKVAIIGEINTYATYMAFAEKAEKDGYRNIANMFRAAAAAENIHARNHNDVLKKMGEPEFIRPTAKTLTVNGTAENIQAALDGETHEFTVTYPGFIATAKKEKCDDAVRSFSLANLAEENHESQFSKALEEGNENVPSKWFVCTQCGGLFDEPFTKCRLCKTDSERQYFIPMEFVAKR